MRSETPLTNYTLTSTELMNESLASRNLTMVRTPTGVPPLDISLDKDHLKWLKEQSMKAQHRSARSQGSPDLRSSQALLTHSMNNVTSTHTLTTGYAAHILH